MAQPGKIFKTGGAPTYTGWSDPIPGPVDATNSTYLIDVTAAYKVPRATPVVKNLTPINHARAFANGVVLPTGDVFIVGGQSRPRIFYDTDAVMTPEIWSPATQRSIDVVDLPTPRTYHMYSSAIARCEGLRWRGWAMRR